MAENAEQLAQEEAVPVYRAEKALDLSDGDRDEARQLLRDAPVAIKSRFASQNNDIYGLFLIMLEMTPPSLKSLSVLVGNHQGIGNVKLSLSPTDFREAIERLIREKGQMSALTEQLVNGLQQEFSPPTNEWIELIQEREELSIQDRLNDTIADSIEEEELLTTVSLEAGLVEGTTSGESTTSETSESSDTGDDQVTFLCDVRVSPVRGKPVPTIEEGDPIFVTLKDSQEHTEPRLREIIERLEDDSTGMIPAPVRSISRTKTGKLELTVQFGENVFGTVVAGEDMNILTPDSVASESTGESVLDSPWTWILMFIVIMAIGLAILYGLFATV